MSISGPFTKFILCTGVCIACDLPVKTCRPVTTSVGGTADIVGILKTRCVEEESASDRINCSYC